MQLTQEDKRTRVLAATDGFVLVADFDAHAEARGRKAPTAAVRLMYLGAGHAVLDTTSVAWTYDGRDSTYTQTTFQVLQGGEAQVVLDGPRLQALSDEAYQQSGVVGLTSAEVWPEVTFHVIGPQGPTALGLKTQIRYSGYGLQPTELRFAVDLSRAESTGERVGW